MHTHTHTETQDRPSYTVSQFSLGRKGWQPIRSLHLCQPPIMLFIVSEERSAGIREL